MTHPAAYEMKAHTRSLSTSSSTAALVDDGVPLSTPYTPARQRREWPTILFLYRVAFLLATASITVAIAGVLAYTIIVRESTKNSRYLDADGKNVMAWPQAVLDAADNHSARCCSVVVSF